MLDQDSAESALKGICSEPEEIPTLMECKMTSSPYIYIHNNIPYKTCLRKFVALCKERRENSSLF